MIRLEQFEVDEVGTVGPDVEVGEGIDLLRGLVGEAWRRRVELIGVGQPVVVHDEERHIDDGLGLDRHRCQVGGERRTERRNGKPRRERKRFVRHGDPPRVTTN